MEGFSSSEKSARNFTMEHCYKENEYLRDKHSVSRTNKALSTELNDHQCQRLEMNLRQMYCCSFIKLTSSYNWKHAPFGKFSFRDIVNLRNADRASSTCLEVLVYLLARKLLSYIFTDLYVGDDLAVIMFQW